MIGVMIAPWFNERYGRKKSFLLLAAFGLVGALIQALSTLGRKFWVLVAGKIVLNISVGIASAVVGVYLAECAPASLRGTLMSNYNIIQVSTKPTNRIVYARLRISRPTLPPDCADC
jgi:MFS family permease